MKIIFILLSLFFVLNMNAQQETSVLFIGNSFTFMNDMPIIFKNIALSKGKNVHVDTVVEGGKDFKYHSNQAETYEKIKSRKWDYVIIQGHSNELAQPESKVDNNTFPYAKKIADSIKSNSNCTQLVLYMTWGYKNGNSKWSAISTYDSMQFRIKNQYLRFADLLNARISPVGEVWKLIKTNYSGINLYDPDNQHPSLEGSYLSACTHFASIFGESPLNNNALVPINDNVRQIVEYNASQVVLNNLNQWRFIAKTNKIEVNFDLVLSNKELKAYNRSKAFQTLKWSFGDGSESSEENPIYLYSNPGNYTVSLEINSPCESIKLDRIIEVK
jgi:hypothetical protein